MLRGLNLCLFARLPLRAETEDGVMRQPEFLRLRDDKPYKEAVIVSDVSDAP